MTSNINLNLDRKPEYVIFLGAGASCSEGAPSQSKLFNLAFKSDCHSRIDPSGHLKKYFRIFWGIDIDKDNFDSVVFPTFEEALGMLELARNRHEAFKGFYSNANKNNIGYTIEDLIYLIAEILKNTLRNQNGHHTELVSNLKQRDVLLKCCFISLNYDILIDNALISARDVCDIDYGIDFMNFEHRSKFDYENWDKPDPCKAVKLFKVHGSLNWLYCPVCNKIKITPKTKAVAELAYIEKGKRGCDICRGSFEPILIPPTYYKNMALTIQSLLGLSVMPAIWTFRVRILIKNKTWNNLGPKAVQIVFVKKSHAHSVSKCLLINASHESSLRLGLGSMPF